HDGIDLPAPTGTKVYAMRRGEVHRAGPGNPGPSGFSSRHVVLRVEDPSDGPMFLVYVHLHSIAEGITVGAAVAQGQFLGTVGEDDATYPHLHIEFRREALPKRAASTRWATYPILTQRTFRLPSSIVSIDSI